MKKLLALTSLVILASSASAQVWFKGSLDEALAKAKTENKKVLLDFDSYT
jgi:hypothetical protein